MPAGQAGGGAEWVPTDWQRGFVWGASAAGYEIHAIAKRLGVDHKTLEKHCAEEIESARMDLIAGAVSSLKLLSQGREAIYVGKKRVQDAIKPELGACCFILKTQGKPLGWIEVERREHTGKDGAPTIPVHMSTLSDAQLRQFIERIDAAENALAGANGAQPAPEAENGSAHSVSG